MKEMAQNTTFQHTKLEKLRKAKKVTQEELADAIRPDVKKISRELIKDFEIGSRSPKIDVVVAFAKYFKVSTDYLFGLTETPTQDTDIRMISDYTGLSESVIQNLHRRCASQRSNIDLWGKLDVTDDMLGELLKIESDCVSLSVPIMQKANRIAVEDIAKKIIANPDSIVPKDKKAEETLEEIRRCIARFSSTPLEYSEEQRMMAKESEGILILSHVIEILGHFIDIQGSEEFDRFLSTQYYLDAYDTVMAKYPESKLIELQKSGLLGNIGLRFISDDMDSGK